MAYPSEKRIDLDWDKGVHILVLPGGLVFEITGEADGVEWTTMKWHLSKKEAELLGSELLICSKYYIQE